MPRSISKKHPGLQLGVDLVEIIRARRFYKTHNESLSSFFTSREVRFIHSGRSPRSAHERLALLLAAKEAVFKAFSPRPTGFLAFRRIEILPGPMGKLAYNWKNAKFPKGASRSKMELRWFQNKHYVVVECFHALGSHKQI